MKKKLEAELISIAHRILKLKNKSDLIQLHLETQKLYEKLSVLKFVEENFADAKPTIGYKEIEDQLDSAFESDNNSPPEETPKAETPELETEKVEEKASVTEVENNEDALTDEQTPKETTSETEKEETAEATEETETLEAEKPEEIPAATESPEENAAETEEEETSESTSEEAQAEEKSETENTPEPFTHITQEEVAEETSAAAEPVIETPKEEIKEETPKSDNSAFKPSFELAFDPKEDPDTDKFNTPAQTSLEDFLHDNYVDPVFVTPEDLQKEKEEKEKAQQSFSSYQSETPAKSLNDRMAKGIIIGLNDRIAFMNHLFNNSSEDYNRVLSQLMTIDNFGEAKNFIDTMVKPDYNNWAGKEEYEQRFMEIVEKKFS